MLLSPSLPSFSSSSLLSIISGLLVSVATELAVFRRGDACVVGIVSLSLLEELRESHENGLVSFRVGGGGGAVAVFSGTGGGGG